MKKPEEAARALRAQLHSLFRNGLGMEGVDHRTLDDTVETEVLAIFKLHARLEMGKAFGISNELMGLSEDASEDTE